MPQPNGAVLYRGPSQLDRSPIVHIRPHGSNAAKAALVSLTRSRHE